MSIYHPAMHRRSSNVARLLWTIHSGGTFKFHYVDHSRLYLGSDGPLAFDGRHGELKLIFFPGDDSTLIYVNFHLCRESLSV